MVETAINILGYVVPSSVLWLGLCIVLVIVEACTVGLITIWFAIGAFVASAVSIFTDSLLIQGISFIGVSILTLALTRPVLKKYFSKEVIKTNADALIGETGIVTAEISKNKKGRVTVKGQDWSGISLDGGDIKEGEEVTVVKIQGASLVVTDE